MHRFIDWFFRNHVTRDITIAQMPNLLLWIVIAAALLLLWIWHPTGRTGIALTVLLKGGLLLWAADEITRGVNPWRRCLGAAVAIYKVSTIIL